MKHRISTAAFLLFAALPPIEGRANIIGVTEIDLFVSASFSSQLQPLTTAFDRKALPFGDLTRAEVLVHANGMQGIPFPNVPTSQTRPFASSAADASGFFGVGVSGFFFPNSLPPNALAASGSTTQRVTNNSTLTFPVAVDFFVPAPTIRLFGVGNSFPPGADPARDATAFADIMLQTRLTHPDGSTVEAIPLDYGLRVVRESLSGVLFPFPTTDGAGSLSRFDDPDGAFGFRLSEFSGLILCWATSAPVTSSSSAMTIAPRPARASARPGSSLRLAIRSISARAAVVLPFRSDLALSPSHLRWQRLPSASSR